jgi:hypothetical protein
MRMKNPGKLPAYSRGLIDPAGSFRLRRSYHAIAKIASIDAAARNARSLRMVTPRSHVADR